MSPMPIASAVRVRLRIVVCHVSQDQTASIWRVQEHDEEMIFADLSKEDLSQVRKSLSHIQDRRTDLYS